jgi:hypothetical protein
MSSINTAGYILNTLSLGFTTIKALGEITDGSHDAGASVVRIHLDSATSTIFHADDGRGQNKDELEEANIRCRRRIEPEADQAGFFGDGTKIGKTVLSQAKHPYQTFSRGSDSKLSYIEVDLPGAIKTGVLTLKAMSLERGSDTWDDHAIAAEETGTLDVIRCDPQQFANVKSSIMDGTLLNRYRTSYRTPIANGMTIVFSVDNEDFPVGNEEVFKGTATVSTSVQVVETAPGVITTLFRLDDPVSFYYFEKAALKKSTSGITLPTPVKYVPLPTHRVIVSDMKVTRILAKDEKKGGFHIQRGWKILDTVPHPKVVSGCLGARKYYEGTHHIVEFAPGLEIDKLMGVQLNKGVVSRDTVNDNIMMTLWKAGDCWVQPLWLALKPKKDTNVLNPKDATIASLQKQLADANATIAELQRLLAATALSDEDEDEDEDEDAENNE